MFKVNDKKLFSGTFQTRYLHSVIFFNVDTSDEFFGREAKVGEQYEGTEFQFVSFDRKMNNVK